MPLTVGVNSYASVASADSYFSTRLDAAAWEEASPDNKEKALVTATSILDVKEWGGVAVSSSQPLSFPRTGSYFDKAKGLEIDFEGHPSRILKATYELAYHLLNNDGLLDDVGFVDTIEVSGIVLKGIKASSNMPSHVYSMIAPMLSTSNYTWWRAN